MTARSVLKRGMGIPQKLFSVTARRVMGTITHVSTESIVAALTFDDGPHPDSTPRLLDVLDRYQARATLFMLGEAAHRYPELVRRVAQAGHAIGNHSWDHASFPFISRRERHAQIRACQRAIAPYGQRLFRPPYGEQNVVSRFDPLWLGYEVIGWNLEVGDWWDHDSHHMTDLLVRQLRPGGIVILHDALREHPSADKRPMVTRQPHADREPMLTALTVFLEQTASRFRFLTIPELLRQGSPQRRNWYRVAPAAG
jgi:peptidoglycan/xylan/chitin deacetylase (PgdA/CDA1 family)